MRDMLFDLSTSCCALMTSADKSRRVGGIGDHLCF